MAAIAFLLTIKGSSGTNVFIVRALKSREAQAKIVEPPTGAKTWLQGVYEFLSFLPSSFLLSFLLCSWVISIFIERVLANGFFEKNGYMLHEENSK